MYSLPQSHLTLFLSKGINKFVIWLDLNFLVNLKEFLLFVSMYSMILVIILRNVTEEKI